MEIELIKRINIVNMIIVKYFHTNHLKSACLAQSYILYKYLSQLKEDPILVKGYIINHKLKIFYGHFWVELNGNVYDIATETYMLDYKLEQHDDIKEMRTLTKTIPDDILSAYKCIDNPGFEQIRNKSFKMCMQTKFLDDVRKNAPQKIYIMIKNIHDKILQ